jgi:hypothetical protein
MTEHRFPQTKLKYEHRITINKEDVPEYSAVFEGEVPMSDQEKDALQQILGDGNASVTVSREVSEMNYGNGGKCFASVTIRCHQDQQAIQAAQSWAAHFAESFINSQHPQMKAQVQALGIIQ